MMRRLAFFLCAIIGLTAQAGAATYYVANTGANASGATCQNISTPCQTITYVYSNLVAAGDTILVQPGTYTDSTGASGFLLNKSGTSGAPITIRSVIKHAAVIDGQNDANHYYDISINTNAKYNVLDGFVIKNAQHSGIGIDVGTNNTITNNEISSNGTALPLEPDGTCNGGNCNGIYISGPSINNKFIANDIHGNGKNVHGHGLYVVGDNTTIENNLIYNNQGYGIQLAAYSTINSGAIYNNTINGNIRGGMTIWQPPGIGTINNMLIKNNIFSNHAISAIQTCNEDNLQGSGTVIDTNVFYGNGGSGPVVTNCTNTWTGYILTNVITGNPLYVGGTDFHLTATGSARNVGINLTSLFTTDLDGSPRPGSGPWDIGAYQVSAPLAQATFVSVNTTLKGTWKGTYGADGYIVIAASKSIPAYVTTTLTETTAPYYVWWKGCHGPNSQFNNANCTADARALQIPDSTYGRIAASYYSSSSLSFPVNMTDGLTHQMAISALDWDSAGRAETIAITDTATGTQLDSRTLAANSFVNGSYVVWTIKGAVTVTVTKTAGPNAVVSGVFFN